MIKNEYMQLFNKTNINNKKEREALDIAIKFIENELIGKEAIILILEFCEKIYKEKEEYKTRLEKVNKNLRNYINKSFIEFKIEEIQEEFKSKNTDDNNEWYIESEKYTFAEDILKELLEGK